MNPRHVDDAVTVWHGDCLTVLAAMPDNSVDAVVTDPPAGISFMGRTWDSNKGGRDAWIDWLAGVLRECLRIAKPGAHAYIWALPRTSGWTHRAIEDAGWEVRDCTTHLFGSGFPKSLNLGDGRGTALKPASEHWWLARKPLSEGSVAGNVLRWGTGGLNIDAGRVAYQGDYRSPAKADGSVNSAGVFGTGVAEKFDDGAREAAGRWPPNVALDPAAADQLDQQSGVILDGLEVAASRFFPVFRYEAKAPTHERPRVQRADGTWEAHATVKPLELMRWLIRLVTPPGGVVLDPFAGSGTTGEAAIVEGFKAVLIEREPCGQCGGHGCPDYLAMIMQRISKPIQPVLDFGA